MRDKTELHEFTLASSLLTHLSLTPLPKLPLTPIIVTILIRNHKRMELGRIINERGMLGLKAIDEGWYTYGVVVGVGKVEIQVESDQTSNLRKCHLSFWVFSNTKVPPLLLCNNCLGGSCFGRERGHVP